MTYEFDYRRLIYYPDGEIQLYDVMTSLKLTAAGSSQQAIGSRDVYVRPSVLDRAKAARALQELEALAAPTVEQALALFESYFPQQ